MGCYHLLRLAGFLNKVAVPYSGNLSLEFLACPAANITSLNSATLPPVRSFVKSCFGVQQYYWIMHVFVEQNGWVVRFHLKNTYSFLVAFELFIFACLDRKCSRAGSYGDFPEEPLI